MNDLLHRSKKNTVERKQIRTRVQMRKITDTTRRLMVQMEVQNMIRDGLAPTPTEPTGILLRSKDAGPTSAIGRSSARIRERAQTGHDIACQEYSPGFVVRCDALCVQQLEHSHVRRMQHSSVGVAEDVDEFVTVYGCFYRSERRESGTRCKRRCARREFDEADLIAVQLCECETTRLGGSGFRCDVTHTSVKCGDAALGCRRDGGGRRGGSSSHWMLVQAQIGLGAGRFARSVVCKVSEVAFIAKCGVLTEAFGDP